MSVVAKTLAFIKLSKKTDPQPVKPRVRCKNQKLLELVHCVVFARSQQSIVSGEIFLVIVANIRTGQILVFHRSLIAANFLTLNVADIGQHTQIAEIAFRQNIYAQRRFVIGRQGDEMVENTGFARGIAWNDCTSLSASAASSLSSNFTSISPRGVLAGSG